MTASDDNGVPRDDPSAPRAENDQPPAEEEGALVERFERDTPARITARLMIENGSTFQAAARAVGVTAASVSNWAKAWERQGWERPEKVGSAVLPDSEMRRLQTMEARRELEEQWAERRTQIGVVAGGLAGQALGRIRDLMPLAGQPEMVVEQARDIDGNPVGLPRHRVLVRVPSLEVWRLSEAAKTLFSLADRATGLATSVDVAVNLMQPATTSWEERRQTVLDVLARLPEAPQQPEGDGRESNGHETNGHGG